MEKFTSSLENIKIAAPCSADWNEMVGDERQRHCGACKLNVYNLSGMSRAEAENLIFKSEGNRLCVRFYRRADGTILTKDCPVGWQAFKKNISKTATAFASLVFAALGGIGLTNYFASSNERSGTKVESRSENSVMGAMANKSTNSNVAVQSEPVMVMGEVSPQNSQIVGQLVKRAEIKHESNRQKRR